jgi:ribosomal protein S27AE
MYDDRECPRCGSDVYDVIGEPICPECGPVRIIDA